MQRITKFSAIIGFLAVMTFVIGMFMYMPTISTHGASLSPANVFAFGTGGDGGCCGGGGGDNDFGGGGDNDYTPPIVVSSCDLNANRTTINAGGSAVLTWTTSRVDKVIISPGIGQVAEDGSMTVSPTATTKYVLTAKRNGNVAATCDVTIVVKTVVPNPACTLTLSPNSIRKGETATLSWTTTNADTVTLNGNAVAKNDSRSIAPVQDRTFRLVATNAAGKTVTCEKTITVTDTPNPVCTFDAAPNRIQRGQNATLTWTTTNADSVSINRGIGSVALDGSRTVSPNETVTYTLTATGNGKTVTCSDTIIVNDVPPTLSCDAFSASPSSFDEDGGTTNLSWNTTGATSVSINQGIGSVSADGNYSVYVGSSRTFVLTASNGSDTVTCQTYVRVDEDEDDDHDNGRRPECDAFRASDKDIEEGDTVELSWETTRGDELTIKDSHGRTIFDTDDEDEVEEGEIRVSPKEDTTYTLRVYDRDNDTDTCTVRINVDDREEPVIISQVRDREPVTTISFRQVPYTGFDAGPTLAITFYALLALWALVASYIVVIKKGSVLGFSLATVGLGATAAAYKTPVQTPVIARSAVAAPVNLPIASDEDEEEDEDEVVEDDEEADSDEEFGAIENRAFTAGMILSKDALAVIARAGRDTAERLVIADAIIARAKETYPREDGWIAIDKARIEALFK